MLWLWIPASIGLVAALVGGAGWSRWRASDRRFDGLGLEYLTKQAVTNQFAWVITPLGGVVMSMWAFAEDIPLPWVPVVACVIAAGLSQPLVRATLRALEEQHPELVRAVTVGRRDALRRWRYLWAPGIGIWSIGPALHADQSVWFFVIVATYFGVLAFVVMTWMALSLERSLESPVQSPTPA